MTIDLNDKSNLVCVSISPQLTNDTLFIKEDLDFLRTKLLKNSLDITFQGEINSEQFQR